MQHVLPSSKGLHVEVEHKVSSGLSINPLFPSLTQNEEGSDTDRHVAASAAGLQQRDASFEIKHEDEKQCTDSESSINPLFPFSWQNTFGAEIEEHKAGGAGLQHLMASLFVIKHVAVAQYTAVAPLINPLFP